MHFVFQLPADFLPTTLPNLCSLRRLDLMRCKTPINAHDLLVLTNLTELDLRFSAVSNCNCLTLLDSLARINLYEAQVMPALLHIIILFDHQKHPSAWTAHIDGRPRHGRPWDSWRQPTTWAAD